MEFKEKLQQLRKKKNITQEELAEKMIISRTAISKWESGRGYPTIDSLKRISEIFEISIDDLISSEELIFLAQEENNKQVKNVLDIVFGLLDCTMLFLFFLPLFGERVNNVIYSVPLISLTTIPLYLKIPYFMLLILSTVIGILILALQNTEVLFWNKIRLSLSVLITLLIVVLFIASSEPYAATLCLGILAIKGYVLVKRK